MENLIEKIEKLKKSSVKQRVDERIKEFEVIGKKGKEKIFSELCFCLMTANFSAEKGIKIQNALSNDFLCDNSISEMADKLKKLGHRFPNVRAAYICEARNVVDELIESLATQKEKEIREWLVDNVKGLGYKEASHFLRNIGYKDVAIVDFHIVDLLVKNKLIEKPKTMTKKNYLEIEKLLREIAKKTKLSLAELDLYLWQMETGKILK